MDEKTAFIAECLRGELPMTALCEGYGISRDTGYRLLGRYREAGLGGLEPRSRAPHRHGMAMPEEVAKAIMSLRRQRPFWGPKKLRRCCSGAIRNSSGRRPRQLAICCGAKG
jgi:transposase